MIIVEPFGGLANRMRVIASGLWLSKKTNHDLTVVWNMNEELNCSLENMFEPMNQFTLLKESRFKRVKATNQEKFHRRLAAWMINLYAGVDYCIKEEDFKKNIWSNKIDLVEIARKNKTIYFHTCEEFGDNLEEFQIFKPVAPVRELIETQTRQFNSNTIGLHIRRSDNLTSIRESPLELFISKIREELEKDASTRFFLATDDKETEEALKEMFGEKIITYNKELSRNSTKGIQDAVVDMYCLSKTKFIYGSYWSSYSDIAARMGKISFIPLKKGE